MDGDGDGDGWDVWILTSISGSHPGFLRALTCLGSSSKRRSRIRQRALSRLRGSDSLQLHDLLVEKVPVVLYRSMGPIAKLEASWFFGPKICISFGR